MVSTSAGSGFSAESQALQTAAKSHMPQQVSFLDSIRSLLSGRQVPGAAFGKVSQSQTAANNHQNNVQDGVTRLRDAMRRLGDWITGVDDSDQQYRQNDQDRAQQTNQVAQGAQPAQDQGHVAPVPHRPANVPSWGPSGPPPDGGRAHTDAQVDQWIDQARQVLSANGTNLTDQDAQRIAGIIHHESTNNPHAVNLWDRNALAGHPSKGLMQTIDSTFDQYHLPGHDDIYDPVDNIIAGTRYALGRYHNDLGQVPGVRATEHGHDYQGY